MTDRFDITFAEDKGDGTKRWHNVGAMFPAKNGKEGFSIKLVGPHGVTWLSAFPAKEKDQPRQGFRPAARDDDSEIPF